MIFAAALVFVLLSPLVVSAEDHEVKGRHISRECAEFLHLNRPRGDTPVPCEYYDQQDEACAKEIRYKSAREVPLRPAECIKPLDELPSKKADMIGTKIKNVASSRREQLQQDFEKGILPKDREEAKERRDEKVEHARRLQEREERQEARKNQVKVKDKGGPK